MQSGHSLKLTSWTCSKTPLFAGSADHLHSTCSLELLFEKLIFISREGLGNYIVEYEQNGEERAAYGDKLLASLAKDLKGKGMNSLSKRNLHYFSLFYLKYPTVGQFVAKMDLPKSIVQTLSAQSETMQQKNDNIKVSPQLLISRLSFSHIIELMGEKD